MKPASPVSPRAERNRRNAAASTGPRTAAGKAKAARNALRHGLNCDVMTDAVLAPAIRRLAVRLCGANPSPWRQEASIAFASALFDVERIRAARLPLFRSLYAA